MHKAEKGLKCCTWNLFLLGMECRTRSSQNTGIAGMGGGIWPLPRFLWRICPHALRALKGDHSSPKSDNFPTKVFLFPRNHINLTFSLSKMIYTLLSKNVASCLYALLWTIFGRMWLIAHKCCTLEITILGEAGNICETLWTDLKFTVSASAACSLSFCTQVLHTCDNSGLNR